MRQTPCAQVLRFAYLLTLLSFSRLIAQTPAVRTVLPPNQHVAIVSVIHSKDSRGETVYQPQGTDHPDAPVVPGTLTDPRVIKAVKPKYSRPMKDRRFVGQVTVEAVITANGDVIDLEVTDSTDRDASASALDSVSKYRFHPATIDNTPVASSLRVVVNYALKS